MIANSSFSWYGSSLSCADQKCACPNYYVNNPNDVPHENAQKQPSTSGISQLVAASTYLERISSISATKSMSTPLFPRESYSVPSNNGQSSLPNRIFLSIRSQPTDDTSYPMDSYQQNSGSISSSLNNSSAHPSTSGAPQEQHYSGWQQKQSSISSNKIIKRRGKEFSCQVCNKAFAQNGNLKTHMMVHTGERPYSCPICGKSFTQKGNVDTHIKIHTGERDYRCDDCGKSFSQKGNLKQHMRSVHIRAKPFKCGLCGRCFTQKVNLEAHCRTHSTAEDRLACTFCGKTFAHRGSLKSHIQSHADMIALEQYVERHQAVNSSLHQAHSQNRLSSSLSLPVEPFQYYPFNHGLQ